MSEQLSARCFLITGRVQGVFFRASTREQALRLGLVGYAKNLPDGRVEVLAQGKAMALEALAQWLWQGPPAAAVTEVIGAPIADDATLAVSGFVTL